MGITIVEVDDVSKRFVLSVDKSLKERVLYRRRDRGSSDFWALRDIDLSIEVGSTVGLVGHNGSGKSTLLKVIGGIIEPTSGTVRRRGRLAALLELGAGFHPDLTGRENVYLNAAILGMSRRDTEAAFDSIVAFAEIGDFIDSQVKFYSSGMYVRLAFAVAVHTDPDLLLVDEVLAVGDEPFQRKCMDKISEFQSDGRTIVLVSHSADQVGRLCDRVVVLSKGEMVFDGETEEGLKVLRQGYEATRRSLVPDRGTEERTAIQLREVAARVDDGALQIDIDLDINDPRPSWGVGLSLETSLGMRLYEFTTFGLALELPQTPGRHSLRFDLGQIALGAGTYLVNVGLGSAQGETFDRIGGAATFDIPASGKGHGLIRLDPKVSVER